jgi:hypothetical protein
MNGLKPLKLAMAFIVNIAAMLLFSPGLTLATDSRIKIKASAG